MQHRNHLLLIFTLALLLGFAASAQGKQHIRINMEGNPLLPKTMERVAAGEFFATDIDLDALKRRGIAYDVIDFDVEATLRNRRAGYPTFSEVENKLSQAVFLHGDIVALTSLGTTYENRDIWCLEISDNPGVDEGETELLFIGLHHAREWPSVVVTLYIIDQLTSNYGSDPLITDFVNTRRIFVVPCMNADGYYYSHDQGHDWRKNRHYFPSHNTTGVDLNRNYPGATCGNSYGDWGSIGHGSVTHEPSNEVYCGPGAGSEKETQAMMNFILSRKITGLISYHTHGELVLWPYGFSGSAKTPDDALLKATGQAMAGLVAGQSGGTYDPEQSAGLYPTSGDTTDWAYGECFFVHGMNVLPYTFELCTSFQPSYSQMTQVCNENWDAVEYLLTEADNLKAAMTPFVLPPVLDTPALDKDGDYTVSWTEKNPDANAVHFQLQELTDLTVKTDDLESGNALWDLDGFTVTTAKSHSATHSLVSKNQDATISTATSKFPLPVETGDLLRFWTWFDIEVDYDYGFVEVSHDKRKWTQLDSFNGSSGTWVSRQYSLDAFSGKSVFLRFRYSTDAYTLETGFFVDDITMVPDFGTVRILGSSLTDPFYNITGNGNGDYYYRVQGYSNTRGWGDYSTLARTVVEIPVGPEVNTCTPADGSMAGGTAVTITGSGFTTAPDTQVFFGDEEAASVLVVNPSTITCAAPVHPHPGFVDVSVENSTGNGVLEEGFEYYPAPGPPMNMTDLDTLNLPQPPVTVRLFVTGDAGAMYLLFLSFGAGPTNTPYGIMGLDQPIYWLATSFLGAKGYSALKLNLPALGPLDFYLHALVDDSPPGFAGGGNNPNGTGSVKFVLP